jgi:hypothetical protein
VNIIPNDRADREPTEPVVVRQHGDGTGSAYAPRRARNPLDVVREQLSATWADVAEWRAGQTDVATGRTYVAAGHRAVRGIDAMLRELHRVRGNLVDELRRDEDERAVRADLLLAQIKAEREGGTR